MTHNNFADQLTMRRLAGVEYFQEFLKAPQRTKARRGKTLFGSRKFHQKAPSPPDRPQEISSRFVHTLSDPRRIEL